LRLIIEGKEEQQQCRQIIGLRHPADTLNQHQSNVI